MKPDKAEYFIKGIVLLVYVVTATLPNNFYILKAIGIAVTMAFIWFDDIKKVLSKLRKKHTKEDDKANL